MKYIARKCIGSAAFAALCLFGMSLQGVAEAAPPVVWKLASGYPSTSFHTENLRQFARDVDTATGGQLKIEVYPNNSLAKLAEISAKVESGELAAGEVIMSSLARQVPVAGVDSVPFIVSSFDDARRLWQHQRPLMDAALGKRGMVELYAVPWPSQGLYSQRPVKSPVDLKGSNMRTYNPATVRIAQMLSASPVDVPMTEVPQALAAGRIDSMITSGLTGVEAQAWSQLKYFYDIRAWYPKNIVLVNRKAFEALDPSLHGAVRNAAAIAEQRGWRMAEEAAANSTATLVAHGMKIDPISFELRTELRRFGERFSIEWVRATGNDASAILIPYYVASAK